MNLGKITGTQTFDERNIFSGMDVTAEYVDSKGRVRSVSFHYAYFTNNLRGLVEKTLHSVLESKEAPLDITNVNAG